MRVETILAIKIILSAGGSEINRPIISLLYHIFGECDAGAAAKFCAYIFKRK
jgi:hypothetical protein